MYRPYPKSTYHLEKQAEAQARIAETIRLLLEEKDALPDGAGERARLIASRGQVSMQTLYKSANKPFWHPRFRADDRSVVAD
ncbi:MAG: hypothetical protein WCA35_00155 [Kovacikia sp.]